MKICSRCKIKKDDSEFNYCPSLKRLDHYCKICSTKKGQEWYWANREEALRKKREVYAKNKDKERERRKKRRTEYKMKQRRKLERAIYRGTISKPIECSKCGKCCITQGHHEDYSKPFNVVWLCSRCHSDLHRTLAY